MEKRINNLIEIEQDCSHDEHSHDLTQYELRPSTAPVVVSPEASCGGLPMLHRRDCWSQAGKKAGMVELPHADVLVSILWVAETGQTPRRLYFCGNCMCKWAS